MIKITIGKEKDFQEMIKLYKESFKVHDIFQRDEKEIKDYIKNIEGEFMIAREDGKLLGALLMDVHVNAESHALIRVKHVAVAKEKQGKGIGTTLLNEVDKKIEEMLEKKEIESAKIEIHTAESEDHAKKIRFYEKNGYKKEGKLSNHYRKNETCYVLGKSIQ